MYCWNAATYKWTIHNGKIEINSFGVKKVVSETRRAYLQKFEYTNGATRRRKSKGRQHNGLHLLSLFLLNINVKLGYGYDCIKEI